MVPQDQFQIPPKELGQLHFFHELSSKLNLIPPCHSLLARKSDRTKSSRP